MPALIQVSKCTRRISIRAFFPIVAESRQVYDVYKQHGLELPKLDFHIEQYVTVVNGLQSCNWMRLFFFVKLTLGAPGTRVMNLLDIISNAWNA